MRHSERGTFNSCPFKYKLEKDGVKRAYPTLNAEDRTFGIAIHEALKAHYEGKEWEEIVAEYSKLYPSDKEYASKAKSFEGGIKLLEAYRVYWSGQDELWEVIGTEVEDTVFFNDEEHSLHVDLIARNKQTSEIWAWDHKAQPLESLILTPHGWKKMGEIKIGDEVIGSDGHETKVTGVFPQGKLETYKVKFYDGSEVECSLDHLWDVTSNYGSQQTKVIKLEEIIKEMAIGFGKRGNSFKFKVPIVNKINFKINKKLPIHPYLLGILIGDGCISGHTSVVSIGNHDAEETVNNIKKILSTKLTIKKCKGNNCSWIILPKDVNKKGANTLSNKLRKIGLMGKKSYEKFIPSEYLTASIKSRLSLLQGLLDTDGFVYKNQTIFDSTSQKLASEVVNLVRSLGGVSKLRKRKGTKRIAYRVEITLNNEIIPFRLKRKREKFLKIKRKQAFSRYIKSVEKIGMKEMQCISVYNRDGLYVTNDFILTHNTTDKTLFKGFWKKYELDAQITRYTKFIKDKYGSCGGFIINAMQTGHRERAYKGEPAGYYQRFERQPFSRNDAQIKFWEDSEKDWAELIEVCAQKNIWPKHFGSLCGYCDYYELCMSSDSPSVRETIYANETINIIDETGA